MDAYLYMKQRKVTKDSQAVYFDIHWFLCCDHVARQATETERKLQSSHYDCEKDRWGWDKYVTLHKEQQTIMESLTDYGYSGMDIGTKACYFSQEIKSTELEAAVNVVWAQPENTAQILIWQCLIWAKWSQRRTI